MAQRLDPVPPVVELDVTQAEQLDTLADRVSDHLDGLDDWYTRSPSRRRTHWARTFTWCPGRTPPWRSGVGLVASRPTKACLPLFGAHASVVGLDFDASVAWPAYGWMGVAKAALESTARYLACELGSRQVRVNLVSAGPLRTMAMKSIPSVEQLEGAWARRAPLGWDVLERQPAGRACVALLSDWFPATTGEIVHVDGGYHVVGV